jgi:serine/threonine-protein kinase
MLTGRVPFDAETAIGVVLKHVTEDPVRPRTLNPQADERLEAVCLKAMRKKRDDRYASAREMRVDLRALLGGTDPLAHAATQQFASPEALASAPTAVALDSSKVVVAATASKLTPAGTVTDSGAIRTGRGRTLAVVMVSVAVAAGAFGAWKLRALTSAPPAAATVAEPAHVDSPTPVAASVPESKTTELPPLDLPTTATSRAPLSPPLPPVARNAGPSTQAPPASLAAPPPPPAAPSSVSPPPAAPVPPPPTVAAAPPPPAAPAPAPAPFDPSHAHVDWSVAGAGGGATPGAVQRALSRRAGSWTQCYRAELGRRNARVEGSASLHLTTDESGNVVGTSVRGFEAMPGVQSCVAGAARVKIDGVDTGDAWADVQLTFKAE